MFDVLNCVVNVKCMFNCEFYNHFYSNVSHAKSSY